MPETGGYFLQEPDDCEDCDEDDEDGLRSEPRLPDLPSESFMEMKRPSASRSGMRRDSLLFMVGCSIDWLMVSGKRRILFERGAVPSPSLSGRSAGRFTRPVSSGRF